MTLAADPAQRVSKAMIRGDEGTGTFYLLDEIDVFNRPPNTSQSISSIILLSNASLVLVSRQTSVREGAKELVHIRYTMDDEVRGDEVQIRLSVCESRGKMLRSITSRS